MFVIGVTGGIGSGKSEILRYLKEKYSCRVLLTDDAAKEMEAPGGPLYVPLIELLRNACGESEEQKGLKDHILLEDGNLNTSVIASLIFQQKDLLKKVNELVHPAVCQHILDEIKKEREAGKLSYFVIESALLIESGLTSEMDTIWYIYCDEKVRRERLKASRGYSDQKIDGIIRKQMSEEDFRGACDVVIDNSGELCDSFAQIDVAMMQLHPVK